VLNAQHETHSLIQSSRHTSQHSGRLVAEKRERQGPTAPAQRGAILCSCVCMLINNRHTARLSGAELFIMNYGRAHTLSVPRAESGVEWRAIRR